MNNIYHIFKSSYVADTGETIFSLDVIVGKNNGSNELVPEDSVHISIRGESHEDCNERLTDYALGCIDMDNLLKIQYEHDNPETEHCFLIN